MSKTHSLRVAIFVSGGGTNMQAILDAKEEGKIAHGDIALVLASNPNAYALERAKKHGIPSVVVRKKDFTFAEQYDEKILSILRENRIDLVVLAGFLSIIGKRVIEVYRDRIINVHPSLIPSFCGDGFYGLRVHEAALSYGVKVTGATVHFVNEVTDGGRIIAQKAVEILPNDTPETLQRRVMEQAEWLLLPQAVADLCESLEPLVQSCEKDLCTKGNHL